MDKKLYFAPKSEVIKIETLGMLAGSPKGTDEGGSDTPIVPGDGESF